jgi:hypothetical protein
MAVLSKHQRREKQHWPGVRAKTIMRSRSLETS